MSAFQIAINARYDTAEEATEAAILRSGKSFKEVGTAVFPGLKVMTAYMRVKQGLHPARPEKLTGDELLKIARFCGEYDFIYYSAHFCGLCVADAVSPEQELDLLSQSYNQKLDELRELRAQIEAVKPKLRTGS